MALETFTDVPWANADVITEQKLDDMVANDRYLKDELKVRTIATELRGEDATGSGGGGGIQSVGMEFAVGALTLTSSTTTSTSFVDLSGTKNFNISTLTKQTLQTLIVRAVVSVTKTELFRIPFYVHQDMNYLSIWAQIARTTAQGPNQLKYRGLVVMVSDIDEGFTP